MLMVFSCQKVYDEDCLLLSLVMFLYVIYLYDDMNLYVGRISMYIYVFREEREQERVSEIENGKLWQYIELYLVGACQVWYMSQISIIHLPQEYEWKMQLWEKSNKHFKYFLFLTIMLYIDTFDSLASYSARNTNFILMNLSIE